MAFPTYTYSFTNGSTADATQVNQNFSDILNGISDTTKDISINALTVAGTATLNGNITLGNATADLLSITASLNSSIVLNTNNSFDIGAASKGLASVYLGSAGGFTTRLLTAASANYTMTLPPAASPGVMVADSSATLTVVPITDVLQSRNLGLSVTAGSNILTIALKQADGSTNPSTAGAAVRVALRSSTATSGAYNERAITSSLSQTISAGTTLGMLANQANNLWIYLIDSDGAGTMKIGASTVKFDDASLPTTVAESAALTSISNATPAVLTLTAHGLNNGDAVTLTNVGGSLPTGFSQNTQYFVVVSAANTFELSLTPGGTAINTSSAGSGTHTFHVASGRLVSDAVYTSKPIRLIGVASITNSTTGNWTTPNSVSLNNGSLLPEVIRAKVTKTGTQAVTTNVTDVTFATMVEDTHGSWPSTNYIWIQDPGDYLLSCQLSENSSVNWGIAAYKNASLVQAIGGQTGGIYSANGTALLTGLVTGDKISIRVTNTTTVGGGTIAIMKVPSK